MYNYKIEDWKESKRQLKSKWAKAQILRGLKKHKGEKAKELYNKLK